MTCAHIIEPLVGHCGPPLECAMVKLVDIVEMGYYAKENKGEVRLKIDFKSSSKCLYSRFV